MKINKTSTPGIVVSGSCLLIALTLCGFIAIYLEIQQTLKISERPSTLKRELIDLNNTLSSMYQAEGTVGFLSVVSNDNLKFKYDSLMNNVLTQISIMKFTSNNLEIFRHLDSLYILMIEKQQNATALFELMKNIEENTVKEITQTSISAWNDIDKLNKLLMNKTQEKEDTILIIGEKKGLFHRIVDAVTSSRPDSFIHVNKNKLTETN